MPRSRRCAPRSAMGCARSSSGWRRARGETVAAYVEHQESHCLDRTQLYAGVREGLERLGGKVTMGVVSNKPTALCVQILRGLGVIPHFKVVIGGDTPAGRKPAPGPLLRALESLGSTPWDTLTVGDSPADLEAGRAAGTATAAVTWGYRPAALLASLRPDFTFARFDDLAKAFTRDGAPQNVLEAVGRDALLSLAKGSTRASRGTHACARCSRRRSTSRPRILGSSSCSSSAARRTTHKNGGAPPADSTCQLSDRRRRARCMAREHGGGARRLGDRGALARDPPPLLRAHRAILGERLAGIELEREA